MDINVQMIMDILQIVLYVVLGGFALWYRTNAKLNEKVNTFINEAESAYKDTVKAGGMKHEYVVDRLYRLIPAPLKVLFSYDMVSQIVDKAFEGIEDYAKQQLDKIAMNYTE